VKKFRDVVVSGSTEAMASLRTQVLAGPWEVRMDLATRTLRREAIPVAYSGASAPASVVWLFFDADSAEVTNIVPSEAGALTHEEYNLIAQRFVDEVLQPPARSLGLQIQIGPVSYTLRDVAPEAVVAALERFSGSANKATGAGHPLDAARWDDFVIAAHADKAELGSDDLQRWLVEEQGWDDSIAHELAIEYERARRLLKHYDASRDG